MLKRRARLIICTVLVLSLVAACGGASEDPATTTTTEATSATTGGSDTTAAPATTQATTTTDSEPEELRAVKVGSATDTPGPAQSPYSSLPIVLGYDVEEGIQFEPVGIGGSAAVVQAIEAGAVDMGLVGTEAAVAAIAQGMNAKLTFFAITGNVQVPYVLADSDIETFADFEGKTIGVLDLAAALVNVIEGSVASAGGDPSTLTFVTAGSGAEAYQALESGRIDVLGLPDSFAGEVAALGAELRPITDETFEALGATYGLLVPAETMENDPQLVVAVGRSIAKSTLFATLNPEAAVRLHWEYYPDFRPEDEEEALPVQASIAEFRMNAMGPIDGQWGNATDEQLQTRIGLVEAADTIEEGAITIDDIWTDEFLDEINDFDEAAVEEDAAAGGAS